MRRDLSHIIMKQPELQLTAIQKDPKSRCVMTSTHDVRAAGTTTTTI